MFSSNSGIVEREALADLANVYAGQTFVETDKAGYLIRQWIASSLYDRIRCVSSISFFRGSSGPSFCLSQHSPLPFLD